MLPVYTTMAVMCHVLVVLACSFVSQDPDAATAGSPAMSAHVATAGSPAVSTHVATAGSPAVSTHVGVL